MKEKTLKIIVFLFCASIISCSFKFAKYYGEFGIPTWEGSGDFIENELIVRQNNEFCFVVLDGLKMCVPQDNSFRFNFSEGGEIEICNSLPFMVKCHVIPLGE